jgi:hypothetical protein
MLAAIRRASLGEQFRRRSSPRLILEIDIRKLLAVVVAHDKAGFQFIDRPGRREANGLLPGTQTSGCLPIQQSRREKRGKPTALPFPPYDAAWGKHVLG